MMHPRLSVSEMCTYPWPLADELELWDELGVRQVGLISAKVDAFGRDAAIAALRRALDGGDHRDHGDVRPVRPDRVGHDPQGRQRGDRPRRRAGRVHVLHAGPARRAIVRRARGVPRRRGRAVRHVRAATGRPARHRAVAADRRLLRAHLPRRHRRRGASRDRRHRGHRQLLDGTRRARTRVRRAGSRIAVVQFSDAVFGTTEHPSPGGRVVPGDGDLALDAFIEAALDTGYTGAFELEVVGPAIEAEGHGAALRRSVERANALLHEVAPVSRAIVFNGDETWEERDLPVPEPRPGGAVLRVEATGLCHSDFDHFQGRVHTPWGGEFPSIAGHEIVGPDRPHRSGRRPRVGRRRGRPRRGARHGRDRRRLPHLRPRLLGRRGLRTVRRLRRAPGAPARLDGVPPPRRPPGRGAHLLRAVELRGDVGAPDPGRRRRRHRRAGAHGHGDDRRRPRRGRGDGDRHRGLAGSVPPRHRVARRRRSRDRRRTGGRGRARRRRSPTGAWRTW